MMPRFFHFLCWSSFLLCVCAGPAGAQQREGLFDTQKRENVLKTGVVKQDGDKIRFEYTIPYSGYVQLALYTTDTQQIELTAMVQPEGTHEAVYRFRDHSPFAEYLYRFTFKGQHSWSRFSLTANGELAIRRKKEEPATDESGNEDSSGDGFGDEFGEFDFDEDGATDDSGTGLDDDWGSDWGSESESGEDGDGGEDDWADDDWGDDSW